MLCFLFWYRATVMSFFFFFSSRRRHTRSTRDWSSDVCSSDLRADRDVLNLLSKRAGTLHLGIANYCWFADPARALCLKLAGTPDAGKPLAGLCDSARCPQATHHPCHRDVWAGQAAATKVFLGSLGPTRKTEKTRLQADYDRAQRVIAEIDAAASPAQTPGE